MILSPYPLLTLEQGWTPVNGERVLSSYQTFGGDTAEAVYIAARALLQKDLDQRIAVHDYTTPAWPGRKRIHRMRWRV